MKSKKFLESFTTYCETYPEQRFWQALRNWSGYRTIYGERNDPTEFFQEGRGDLEDTFYKE